jgi:hypothetical protein
MIFDIQVFDIIHRLIECEQQAQLALFELETQLWAVELDALLEQLYSLESIAV